MKIGLFKVGATGMALIACIMFIFDGLRNIDKSINANSWEAYRGKALRNMGGDTEINLRWVYKPTGYLSPVYKYTYIVAGKQYRSDRTGFGASYNGPRLKRGDEIRVFVNPSNHAESTLVRGIQLGHAIPFVFAILFYFLTINIWNRIKI